MAELTTESHLETIDYKPPAKPASTLSFMTEEKKTNYDDDEDERRGEHDDNDAEDDGKFDLYSEEAEWDEGGKSHCGYGEAVHSTLMSVGETVHKMVGDPSPKIEKELKAVGNWFQEASYAARDLLGGKEGDEENEAAGGMGEDAMDAVKTLLRGGSNEGDETAAPAADSTDAAATSSTQPGESTA